MIEKAWGGAGSANWTLATFYAGGTNRTIHTNGGFPSTTTGSVDLGLNEFHHIVWTRHGNIWDFYVDGIKIYSQTYSGDTSASGLDLYIGRRNPGDGRYFNMSGSLDDIRLYQGSLSYTEIQALASGLVPEPASLLLMVMAFGLIGVKRFF